MRRDDTEMPLKKEVNLKVVGERPVAQHLEERVMIDVLADVVQVVVLAAGANTLLRVARALPSGHLTVRIHAAQEQRFELYI